MTKVAKAKELVVQCTNRVGLLADVAATLAGANVNIHACCCWSMGDQSTFMMVVDRHAAAKKILTGAGYAVTEDPVIRLDLDNKPGALAKAAQQVSGAGVDMEYTYASAAGRNAVVIVKSKDDALAMKALRK